MKNRVESREESSLSDGSIISGSPKRKTYIRLALTLYGQYIPIQQCLSDVVESAFFPPIIIWLQKKNGHFIHQKVNATGLMLQRNLIIIQLFIHFLPILYYITVYKSLLLILLIFAIGYYIRTIADPAVYPIRQMARSFPYSIHIFFFSYYNITWKGSSLVQYILK